MLRYIRKGCKRQKRAAFGTGRATADPGRAGFSQLRVWLGCLMAFSSAARRCPRHTVTLTKQRFHVLMATSATLVSSPICTASLPYSGESQKTAQTLSSSPLACTIVCTHARAHTHIYTASTHVCSYSFPPPPPGSQLRFSERANH